MRKRVKKVNELIKRTLGKILFKEFSHPKNSLITITRVETSANLIKSKVFINIIPKEKEEIVIESLKKEVYHIQQKLNKNLKIRPVPKIIFKIDESVDKAAKVEAILNKINDKKAW
jgi:ribosome-binding factor A